jgi:hypothetical protein
MRLRKMQASREAAKQGKLKQPLAVFAYRSESTQKATILCS